MRILGIETSCDETSAAVVEGRRCLSSVVSSQVEHLEFGGVVPELAARAHLRQIQPIVAEALRSAGVTLAEIDAVAATRGPGLIGALLVGFGFGRALALARGLPFAAVNHIEGHLLSPVLTSEEFEPPFVALIVSGGHTELILCREWHEYEILGSTLDDAVGEAFDKVSVLLGLGYPGGPRIQAAAAGGRSDAHAFPRAWLESGRMDMSFSGLKTAVRLTAEKELGARNLTLDDVLPAEAISDIAASFQEAVIEVLTTRLGAAVAAHQAPRAVIAGGVAANRPLRERAVDICRKAGVSLHLPPLEYCGDNAAMIAAVGAMRLERGDRWPLSTAPVADLRRLGL